MAEAVTLERAGKLAQCQHSRTMQFGNGLLMHRCRDCGIVWQEGSVPSPATIVKELLLEAVRQREAKFATLYGDPEDCEDCAVIESRPCRVHAEDTR